jgi:hypothetical protein
MSYGFGQVYGKPTNSINYFTVDALLRRLRAVRRALAGFGIAGRDNGQQAFKPREFARARLFGVWATARRTRMLAAA